jgi:hypothetical protein
MLLCQSGIHAAPRAFWSPLSNCRASSLPQGSVRPSRRAHMVQPLCTVPPSDEEDVARRMGWRLKRIARRGGRIGELRWINITNMIRRSCYPGSTGTAVLHFSSPHFRAREADFTGRTGFRRPSSLWSLPFGGDRLQLRRGAPVRQRCRGISSIFTTTSTRSTMRVLSCQTSKLRKRMRSAKPER